MTGRVRRGRGGFTLLEVLVALAIVAIALGAGLRAAGTLADNAQRLADATAAQWCAENQIVNLRLGHVLPGIGNADFSCDELGRTWRGQLRTAGTANPNFRRVDAVVFDAAGSVVVTLTAILARQ